MTRKRTRQSRVYGRGFTLVEMAVVVIIVGLLAVVSGVGYRKYVNSSRISEGTQMVGAIRIAQETYKAEIGNYANVSATVTSFYPPNVTPGQKVAWGAVCTNCAAASAAPNTIAVTWSAFNVTPDAPVAFGYMTRSHSTVDPTTHLTGGAITHLGADMIAKWQTGYGLAPSLPWYAVRAVTNPADPTHCTQVVASSFDSAILVDADGEP